jgi:hypothetical protein
MPFVKGQSGNPGGRPKANARLVELAQSQTEAAISTLVGIMTDKGAPAAARVAASGVILDRGWGKAPQTVQGDEENPIHVVNEIVRRVIAPEPRNANGGSFPAASQAKPL